MKTQTEEKKITFIISLILHLLLVALFIFYGFKKKHEFKLSKSAQERLAERIKQARAQTQAALLPKFSDQGAHVVFDDRKAIPKPKEPPRNVIRKVTQAQKEKPVEKKPEEKKREVKKLAQKQAQKIEEKKKLEKKLEKKLVQKEKIQKVSQIQKVPQVQKVSQIQKTIIPEQLMRAAVQNLAKEQKELEKKREIKIEKVIKKHETKKLAQKPVQKIEEKKETITVNLPKTHLTPPEQQPRPAQPRKKSLLALMKTYLDHDQGNSCIIREGANRFPSLEEMKYICYEKKIEDHIISTWRSLYSRARPGADRKVSVSFLIKRDGSVIEAEILQSSGNQAFDGMVLSCIQETMFPPIPKHFGCDTYRPRGGLTVLPSY